MYIRFCNYEVVKNEHDRVRYQIPKPKTDSRKPFAPLKFTDFDELKTRNITILSRELGPFLGLYNIGSFPVGQ